MSFLEISANWLLSIIDQIRGSYNTYIYINMQNSPTITLNKYYLFGSNYLFPQIVPVLGIRLFSILGKLFSIIMLSQA